MQDNDEDDSMAGQDSFIDVVCNMVGVLIILVLIVGMRGAKIISPKVAANAVAAAKQSPATESDSDAAKRRAELNAAMQQAMDAEYEIEAAVVQAVDLRMQSELTEARRHKLTVVQAMVEQDIQQRRAKLDAEGQKQFDVQREMVAAEIRLNELTKQQLALLPETVQSEEVECVPTPLARSVDGEEIHVRLRHKQLAVVPVDELLEEVRRRGGDHLRSSLRNRDQAVDAFGPIDGFRMQLTVEKYATSMPGDSPIGAPAHTSVLLQGVFLPTADDIGQPLEQSLLPGSPFQSALRRKRAASPTVTAWVYPDSYSELRTLKRALWEQNVPLAVRPLADGQPIIFSTAGSKSAAQ